MWTVRFCLYSQDEKDTPQKAKRAAQQWLYEEEITLSTELQKDRVQNVFGSVLPASRADPYWEKLLRRLPFMVKYDKEHSVERLCEKVRRMRLRYEILLQRIKRDEATIFKNKNEENLWRIWHTIWGATKVGSHNPTTSFCIEEYPGWEWHLVQNFHEVEKLLVWCWFWCCEETFFGVSINISSCELAKKWFQVLSYQKIRHMNSHNLLFNSENDQAPSICNYKMPIGPKDL